METLIDFDIIRKVTDGDLSPTLQLMHCNLHLDKLQHILVCNSDKLDKMQKEKLKKMIKEIQNEIIILKNDNQLKINFLSL